MLVRSRLGKAPGLAPAIACIGLAACGGAAADSARMPHDPAGLGYTAAWIPADSKLLATNGSQSQGGSFVTVAAAGSPPPGTSKLRLAQAVATATLASAPRGPNPGPPPS